jgi:hypothetical protein
MQECNFIELDAENWRCTVCGKPLPKHGKFIPWRECIKPLPRCEYLGEQTSEFRLQQCLTCAGNVRIKIPLFTCQVYGTCILADCVNCVSHSAKSCNDPHKPQTAAG